MSCAKCEASVDKDKITCSGFCRKFFHYGCVNVDRSAIKCCSKYSNIFWFCDECRDLMTNRTFSNIIADSSASTAQNSYFEVLKEEISTNRILIGEIIEKLNSSGIRCAGKVAECPTVGLTTSCDYAVVEASLTPTVDVCKFTPNLGNTSALNMASTVSVESTSSASFGTISYAEAAASTSPCSEIPLLSSGTSRPLASIPMVSRRQIVNTSSIAHVANSSAHNQDRRICGTGNLPVDINIKTVPPKCWLHLSRFAPDTAECDILAMANACLGTDSCSVSKLIPKKFNVNSLEYVCFKLGISEVLREKAMNSDTWPVGVFVRSFNSSNFRTLGPVRAKFRSPQLKTTVVNTTPS